MGPPDSSSYVLSLTAWTFNQDDPVFLDIELVVAGSAEGGRAGRSGVGLPGDGPG